MKWKILGLVAVLVAVMVATPYVLLLGTRPGFEKNVGLPKLSATAKVSWDRYRTPKIEGATLLDTLRIQGWVTARDRFFQMDLIRRKMSGRLSELFGKRALALDIPNRRYGFYRTAKHAASLLAPGPRASLEAYAEGVNAFLQSGHLPWDVRLVGYQPDPWTPEDSLLVILSMFASLNHFDTPAEFTVATIREKKLPGLEAFLLPEGGFLDAPILPDPKAIVPAAPPKSFKVLAEAAQTPAPDKAPTPGSNAWVISGQKTGTGFPILASDPHLRLDVPIIWYRNELKMGAEWVTGVSLPGVPGIIIGTNEHVAWAFTNSSIDNADRVLLDWNSEAPPAYAVKRTETFASKGGTTEEVFWDTPWGPVIALENGKATALQWAALDSTQLGRVDLEPLNLAQNASDLLKAFDQWVGPAQNAVFATKTGDIGWTIAGQLPKREGFDGLAQLQRTPGQKWVGYVPRGQFPKLLNPKAGFIATGNQRSLPLTPPWNAFGNDWPNPARGKRLAERLSTQEKWPLEASKDLQLDTLSLTHLWYRDQLLECEKTEPVQDEWGRAVIALTKTWDGRAVIGSAAHSVMRRTRLRVFSNLIIPLAKTLDPKHFEEITERLATDNLVNALFLYQAPSLLPKPFRTYCEALQTSAKEAATSLASNPSELSQARWGLTNISRIRHPLSNGIPKLFHGLINLPNVPLDGDKLVPRVSTPDNGASMRLIVDLGNPKNSIFVMPGGQSGHPLSPNYDDLFDPWAKGEYVPLQAQEAVATEMFQPKG